MEDRLEYLKDRFSSPWSANALEHGLVFPETPSPVCKTVQKPRHIRWLRLLRAAGGQSSLLQLLKRGRMYGQDSTEPDRLALFHLEQLFQLSFQRIDAQRICALFDHRMP